LRALDFHAIAKHIARSLGEWLQVMNVLLGVLDDGRLTDAKGRTVSFANTVIIMTSNLGSDLLLEHGNTPLAKELVMGVVKQHFRPEFLNRLDDVVMFEPLGHEQLRAIARMQVRQPRTSALCLGAPPLLSTHLHVCVPIRV
jgi:ATP-dependent Clp protease ATP-binding subunit ClpA